MSIVRDFDISLTKSGLPAAWECGGGLSSRGSAQVICGPQGQKKKTLTTGHRCNENHALFVLHEGDFIIDCAHWRNNVSVNVYMVTGFDLNPERPLAYTVCTNSFADGCWDVEPSKELDEVVQAGVNKARSYHCRTVFWALPPTPRY